MRAWPLEWALWFGVCRESRERGTCRLLRRCIKGRGAMNGEGRPR